MRSLRLNISGLRSYTRALASGTRLRILGVLADRGELGVAELSRYVGLSQPLMSWHLRRLRSAGLVQARRYGREVRYSLDVERLLEAHHELTAYVQQLGAVRTERTAPAQRPTEQAVR